MSNLNLSDTVIERKYNRLENDNDPKSVKNITDTAHPLATTRQYAVPEPEDVDTNDKSWNHLYGTIVNNLGLSPDNFQLIYPFVTWDWPVSSRGYTQAAAYDFLAAVPQYSATGAYVSAGVKFHDTYQSMLYTVAANTTDDKLQAEIFEATNMLTLATNKYDSDLAKAQNQYLKDTGGSNSPSFTEWLGGYSGKSYKANLEASGKNVDAQKAVLDELISQTETTGLKYSLQKFNDISYYTKFEDPSLENFPPVPAYSMTMDAVTWLMKVKSGTGASSGEIGFANSQAQYDYSKTWAKGSAKVGQAFWSVNVGGSWKSIKEFSSDASLEIKINFEAWDQIGITSGLWYNGSFVRGIKDGPFKRGYSPYGEDGQTAVWGKGGIMTSQKVGMIVCYKPKFTIKVSQSSFKSFFNDWKVSAGLRIGPFNFKGSGGSNSAGWKADEKTCTFSGESTADTALIMGVMIAQINPEE